MSLSLIRIGKSNKYALKVPTSYYTDDLNVGSTTN